MSGEFNMKTEVLELNKITLDPEIQPRVELDDFHIEDMKNDLMEGAELPPVVVFNDGTTNRLTEGFHRWMAYQRAGRTEIVAEIRKGGKRDAQLYGVGSNATHGKRRTNADKRRAVATLLKDEEWGEWSDRHIAEVCRVSQPLVSDVRKELTESGFQFSATRKCSDGREMDVSQIGANRGQESPQTGDASEVVNPTETSQVDDSESAGEGQINTPESSAPETGSQLDDTAESDESQPEVESEEEQEETAPEEDPQTEVREDSAEEPETIPPGGDDDIPTLKAKVATLQEALRSKEIELQEKDSRNMELEKQVKDLEADIAYWFREFNNLDEMNKRRFKAHWTKHLPSGRPMQYL
jgi:hypothetical protein